MPKSIGAQIPIEGEVLWVLKLKENTQKEKDLVTQDSC